MPSLSDLFGLNGSRRINRASAEAESRLNAGNAQALNYLNQNAGAINQGYDAASRYYDTAGGSARNALNSGFDTADSFLRGGYGDAIGTTRAGVDAANARLDPFVASGRGAQGLYDNAIGVNGQPAATDFYDTYASNDPFRQFRDEQANRQLAAQFNARGGLGSGRFGMAVSRASLERGSQDLNAYLDRLERQGVRGAQYAGQQGANDMTGAGAISALQVGQGNALGANATARGVSLSNLDMTLGGAQAGLATGRASALGSNNLAAANQAYGSAQQLASNTINTANGVNAANAVPLQNALNIAGTAVRAYNPQPNISQGYNNGWGYFGGGR